MICDCDGWSFLSPVRRLALCEDLDVASCGDVLFHGYFHPPGSDHVITVKMVFVSVE